jgi:hypothetical protein
MDYIQTYDSTLEKCVLFTFKEEYNFTIILNICNDTIITILNTINKSRIQLINVPHHLYSYIGDLYKKYLYSLLKPFHLIKILNFPYDYKYVQTHFVKVKLTPNQEKLIILFRQKEVNYLKYKNDNSTLLDKLSVVTYNNKIGNSLIPLELSYYDIHRKQENFCNTTIIVIPPELSDDWIDTLKYLYNASYYIINNNIKLNNLLIDNNLEIDDSIFNNDTLINLNNNNHLLNKRKCIGLFKIKYCRVLLITSTYFERFQYYSMLAKINYSRLCYDSFFNIYNIKYIYNDLFEFIYINTKQIDKLLSLAVNNTDIKTILFDLFDEYNNTINNTGGLIIYIYAIYNIFKTNTSVESITNIQNNTLFYVDKSDLNFVKLETKYYLYDYYNTTNTTVSSYIMKYIKYGAERLTNCKDDNDVFNTIKDHTNELSNEQLCSIDTRIKSTTECAICTDTISFKTTTKCCNNCFCVDCYLISISKTTKCPYCRSYINFKDNYNYIVNTKLYNQDFLTRLLTIKKPSNSFCLFQKDKRIEIAREYPEYTFQEHSNLVSIACCKLNEKQIEYYNTLDNITSISYHTYITSLFDELEDIVIKEPEEFLDKLEVFNSSLSISNNFNTLFHCITKYHDTPKIIILINNHGLLLVIHDVLDRHNINYNKDPVEFNIHNNIKLFNINIIDCLILYDYEYDAILEYGFNFNKLDYLICIDFNLKPNKLPQVINYTSGTTQNIKLLTLLPDYGI